MQLKIIQNFLKMNILKINRPKSGHYSRVKDPYYQSKAWKLQLKWAEAEIPKFCAMCKEEGVEGMTGKVLDHIKQRKKGGADDISNYRWLCGHHDAVNQARQSNQVR